ncbi:MAG: DUF192 domain-containing protein [Candidatus Altiarchaeota archaeon]
MKVTAAIILLVLLSGCLKTEPSVCFENSRCIKVEIADSPQEHSKGLMFRDTIEPDYGMLFVFKNDGVYTFWMKNMNFPIDMLWLSSDGTVVHVESNVPPCEAEPCPLYNPEAQASYVLEVSANFSAQNGIIEGSKMDIRV